MLRGSLKSSASGRKDIVQYIERLLVYCRLRGSKNIAGRGVVKIDYAKND